MTRARSLEGSISPLRSRFNDAAGDPRFLALVSPTCGPCLRGAAAVRDDVAGAFRAAGFPVSLVWIPMLPGDSSAAIERAAAGFSRRGLEQFADPDRAVGRLVAASLGGVDSVAWDTYLFYGPEARWTDELPEPAEWVHQLEGHPWASLDRYRCGDDLAVALGSLARETVRRYGRRSRSRVSSTAVGTTPAGQKTGRDAVSSGGRRGGVLSGRAPTDQAGRRCPDRRSPGSYDG